MSDMSPAQRPARETFIPLRIAVLYVLIGGTWILFSDGLVALLVRDPQLATRLQTFKGWLYVLVTAILIYALVKRDIVAISRAERAMRDSQRTLSTLLSNLPGMAYRCRNDRDWTMEFVNDGCFDLTGYHPADLVHNRTISYAQLIHPDDRETVWEEVQAALQENMSFQLTYRIKTATGEEKWVWEQGGGVLAAGEDVMILEGFVTDVTASSQVERALQESEVRYRELFNNMHNGVAVYEARDDGADFIFKDLNQAGQRINQLQGEEVIGKSILEVFPGVKELGLFQIIQRVWQTGQPERHPVSQYQDERISLWVENYVYQLASGEIVAVFEDVTERVRAEEALRRSQLQYQTLAERAPVGIWHTEPDGRGGYVNPKLVEITGLTPETARSAGWAAALHPEDRERVLEEWSAFVQGRAPFQTTYRCQQPDGAVRWVIGQAAPARGADGELLAFIGTLTDITERVQVEQSLRQYTYRLRVLHESDQAILAARSAEEVGQAALDHLQELVPCRVASVRMFDIEGREITVLATYPLERDGLLAGSRLPLHAAGPAQELQQRRELHVVEDIAALPHPTPIEQTLLSEGVRSYVNVPLVAQDELIGSLNLGVDCPGAWETGHLDIAREVADSLAVAIQSTRLIEAERVRLMRESTLLSLANVASSTLDLDEVMMTVLESLRQLISCNSATIQLLEDDALRATASVGLDAESEARGFVYVLDEYPLSRQLIEERLPIRIDDVRLDDRYLAVPGAERTRAFVAVPLLVKGRPVGIITADGHRPGQFSDYDVELVVAVAAHAAIAVENARLFAETRWRAERMAALHEATAAINRAVTITDAFATIRQQVIARLPDALPPVFALLGEDGHSLVSHIVEPAFPLLAALRQATGLELADLRFSFQPARPETRALLEAGQPYVSDDLVSALSHSVPEHLLLWSRDTLGMRGVTVVPFVVEGRLLGLMVILSPRRLAQEDLELLTIFANQAAIVLGRTRLFEEVRAGREQLRELADYLQNAREEERTLIAREIHDEFGQSLTALKIDLAWIGNRLSEDQTTLKEKAASMSELIDDTIHLVRRIATELRPGLLDDLGLAAAIEWQAGEFAERTGVDCELHLGDREIVHDQDLATMLFRILQETLTNVARHARASRVRIDLAEEPGAVTLIVRDDGVGITREQIADDKSLGLVGMRERAHSWGGRVTFEGVPGQGTTVTVRIPRLDGQEGRE